jgi:hypothetical protein
MDRQDLLDPQDPREHLALLDQSALLEPMEELATLDQQEQQVDLVQLAHLALMEFM